MGDNDKNIDKDIQEGFEPTKGKEEVRPLSSDVTASLMAWDVKVSISSRDDEDAGRVTAQLANAGYRDVEVKDGKLDLVIQVNAVNEGAAMRAATAGPLAPVLLGVASWDYEVTLRGETYGDHRHDLNSALESGVGPDGTVDAAQPLGAPAVDPEGKPEGTVDVSTPGERISEAARAPQEEDRRAEAEARVADGDDLVKTDEDKAAMKEQQEKAEEKAEDEDKAETKPAEAGKTAADKAGKAAAKRESKDAKGKGGKK